LSVVALLAAGAIFVRLAPANAQDAVSRNDLQAIARSLGFVDSLPRKGEIAVGIVYGPGGEAGAARTAAQLNAIQGPNSAIFKAQGLPVGALAETPDRFDVVLIADGLCTDPLAAREIAEAVRRLHVVSISSDPACLQARCCVLMVRSDRKVEIVLDTTLANAVGAHFSSVFTMLVKRQ
jgi:hypothetical protein